MKSKITSIVLNSFTNDSRVLKENITLQKAGYAVEVVALHEEGLDEYEEVDGIPVHRIKLTSMNWSKNSIASLIKYVEWSYRIIKTYKNSDIMHCNDLNTLHIGVISKLFNKKLKLVYDAHEYETETIYLKGVKKTLARIIEKFLIKYVDSVITVSESIAKEYVKLYGIDKPVLVLNTPRYQKIEKKDIFRESFQILKEQSIFLYQGNLSRGRGVETVLETFKNLDDDNSVILFMGYGTLEEAIKVEAKKHKNIFFHPAVSPNILLDYTSSADFGISLIEDVCLSYRYCLPNKMFEYIMAEVPVIVSNLPEMTKLVEEHEVGVVVTEHNEIELSKAIVLASKLEKKLLNDNIKKVKEVYNWEEQEKTLLELYRMLYV